MVWIHPGSLTNGESDDFNPVRLVQQGVIVVTINYRLAAPGFLAQKSLDAKIIRRQLRLARPAGGALQRVRDNIGSFGGDPEQYNDLRSVGRLRKCTVEPGLTRRTRPVCPCSTTKAAATGLVFSCRTLLKLKR